jgi:hypothetical protein
MRQRILIRHAANDHENDPRFLVALGLIAQMLVIVVTQYELGAMLRGDLRVSLENVLLSSRLPLSASEV